MNSLLDFLCDQSPLKLPELFHDNSGMDFFETQPIDHELLSIAAITKPKNTKKDKFLFLYHEDGYIIPKNGYEKQVPVKTELDDSACSYEEWLNAGYYLIKGSKSPGKDALGIPQFTKNQTRKIKQ